VLAAAILVVFLGRYRETTAAGGGAESVLVAKTLIEKGTSGEVIATEDLFTVKKVNDDQVEEGAISDPSSLQGKVTSADVLPKQQLTTGALTGSTNAVSARLADYDRAITVGVDTPHGLLGNVRAGDKVDVIGVLGPVVRMLVRDVLVLDTVKIDPKEDVDEEKPVTLRVTDKQAAAIAYTQDQGEVWLVLRPPTRAKQSEISGLSLKHLLRRVQPFQPGPLGGIDEDGGSTP
jgi:Flp pilus assembly protein CpaB